MLFVENAPFNQNDVIAIKLLSGEELIGRYRERNDNKEIVIEKPTSVGLSQVPNSQQFGISFMPFSVAFSQDKVKIPENSIIMIDKAEDRLADAYRKETSSLHNTGTNSPILKS